MTEALMPTDPATAVILFLAGLIIGFIFLNW